MYYAGLPSSPRLLARTGVIPWKEPTGPEAYSKLKQLGVVFNHKLNTIWEDKVAPEILTFLDGMGVKWTSIDVVRIGEIGESAPIVLWIGVKPKTLAGEDANKAAFECLKVLQEFGINNVNIEIRESSVVRSAGPKLLPPVYSSDPTVDVRHPLTYALGLPISAQATPYTAGTGGFFMAEGNDSDKLLLITARHVVLPLNQGPNDMFERRNESKPRFNVILLGKEAYDDYLASIKARIGGYTFIVEHAKQRIKAVEGQDNEGGTVECKEAQDNIDRAEKAMEALYTFYDIVEKKWASEASRILGHVVCSPPIRLGAGTADEMYTEDYAIIEVDGDKIDKLNFKGNVIDLGTEIPAREFTEKMYPNPRNRTSFKYPTDRLLRLWGTIPDEEMRRPTMLDQNEEQCLMVIKNGSASGVTIGRATGIMSYICEYFNDGNHYTSKEWTIIPCDTKSGVFSTPGDSGAVVVDGIGRVGGLLTGGAGTTDSSDITYATPISFLLKSIKANGYPNAHPNPTWAPSRTLLTPLSVTVPGDDF
ncbi:hypothetical protein SERLADRAFT_416027 [Serpula lacrymans var. lacrymans S7.9]|uniref:Peptidase S1 domain-containing protein n=2 Tax=Serpula lacrymans var. lacrymans TaxID=341189 RepID=F8NYD6_SERL9|nr:uncharacterized protein SERLADRAFT_416027 [Serpula lacrymans var. lacrymans S7.9]EGO23607.1 hypothetical protein SERLADRAFT_416027 [Serpula lacrymans var. lacrymans S7.9]